MLIVEDDLALAEMLSAFFNTQGCRVLATAWGERAIHLASQEQPNLVLLDIHLPDIDGFEVCRRLGERHRTRHIPVIFLTERRERMDRLQGLQMGVLDYITKPFDMQELWLRVRNTLDRVAQAQSENPITGLPESSSAIDVLEQTLREPQSDWGILIATVRGLDAFRESYGFVAGDNVLRVISLTLCRAVDEIADEHGFCGHLEQNTLVLIVPGADLDALQERIAERLSGTLDLFYPPNRRDSRVAELDRLALALRRVTPRDGPFASVASLKKRLLESGGEHLIR